MKSKLLVRLIVSVSFCVSFVVSVSSQSPLWIYGNKLIHFSETGITTSNLPQPGLDTNLHYTGQIPNKGQNCQFDNQGNLLFFIVDGNIYDSEGFVIARGVDFLNELDFDIDHPNQLPLDFNDIIITNVPGYCDKFYIFTATRYQQSTTMLVVASILDFTLPNLNFPEDPNRLGCLVSSAINNIQLNGSLNYFFALNYNYAAIPFFQNTFLQLTDYTDLKMDYHSMELIEVSSNHKLLILSGRDDGVRVFNITDSNIAEIASCELSNNHWGIGYYYGAVEAFPSAQSYRLAAITKDCDTPEQATSNSISISELSTTGYISNSNLVVLGNQDNETSLVTSIEFSPDGSKLWFTKNNAPELGVVDMTSLAVSYPFPGLLTEFAYSELEGQTDENGNSVIYASTSTGIKKISFPNNPPNAALSDVLWDSETTPNSFFNGINNSLQYSLQVQNCNGQILQTFLEAAECCHDFTEVYFPQVPVITSSNDGVWTDGNNPFENQSSPIRITSDLIFTTGSHTTINNMVFEFDEDADLIIEKGASVYLHGTTWTSLSCEDIMWPGVDLLGTTNAANSIDQLPVSGGDQGYLNLSNSVIENAMIGIDVGGNVANNAGGIVRASNTDFKNNQNDVMFRKYHYQSGVNYIQNKSYFNSCTFVTDEHLNNNNLSPENHVYLNRVDKIQFRNCSFMNKTDISTYDWLHRGRGIFSYSSSFQVIGSNDPWSMSAADNSTSFYKLTYGIHSYGFNNLRSFYKCAKNEFQYCLYGIVNNNTDNVQIYLNNFTLPDAAGFTSNNTVERGIYLSNSTGYVVEQNFFDGSNDANVSDTYPCAMGIWVHNSGDESNEIRNNDFDEMRLGTYVTGNNIDYVQNVDSTPDTQSDQTGLQLLCNTYTNGRTDIFRASNTSMRWVQGGNQGTEYSDPNINIIPAGNRFSADNCTATVQDFVCDANNIYHIAYWCNTDENAIPDCGGTSNVNGIQLLTVAPLESYGNYSETDCPNHFSNGGVSPGPGVIVATETQIAEINNELNLAKVSYKMIVDKNETLNTIEVLNESFPHESQFYRNLLMQRFPLSDEVLHQVIVNSSRLNPWHLTEVFLANSPLKKEVLVEIQNANILNEFFLGFLYQADSGASLRTLLEMNITGLATQRDQLIQSLAHEGMNYYSDPALEIDQVIYHSPYLAQIENHPSLVHMRERAMYLSANGDYNGAFALISEQPLLSSLANILTIENDLSGEWILADSAQIAVLKSIAEIEVDLSFEIAKGILNELSENISEPEPNFPVQQRSLNINNGSNNKKIPLLGASPNPAQEKTWIHYPIEAEDNAEIQIFDPEGRLIQILKPNSSGLSELTLENYKSGIYVLQLVAYQKIVESMKLVIIK